MTGGMRDAVPGKLYQRVVLSFLVSLIFSGCTTVDDAGVDAWVKTYHAQIEEQRYSDIYESADAMFKAHTSRGEWESFMRNLVTNAGTPVSSVRRGPPIRTYGTDGALVLATYDTKYERSLVEERFTWRVQGRQLVLAGVTMDKK